MPEREEQHEEYIDPFLTISVADPRGDILDTHDTPVAKERRTTHVCFNHQVSAGH